MKKANLTLILQYIYDIFCFAAVITLSIWGGLKDGMTNLIGLIILLFLIPFLSNNQNTNKITFTIVHAFIAWLGWTTLITFYLTDYLYANYIKTEHSIWDIFAFLLPVIFALLTILWDSKYRVFGKWYEPAYLLFLSISIFIVTNCS